MLVTRAGPDRDDIREEIVMSVAQEEVETIVRVAAECDAPLAAEDSGTDTPVGVLPPAIEEALAEVEAELAKAVGGRPADGIEARTPTLSTPAYGGHAGCVPKLAPVETPTTNHAVATPGVSADTARADGTTAASRDSETGIGKLAGFLSTEIHEQWRRAHSAFDQTVATRAKADQASREACTMLKQISRLEEQARLASDHAAEARREAELLRDGARRAKLRADASATAAELAADQAQKNAVPTREHIPGRE
jgi:hypothetical protein